MIPGSDTEFVDAGPPLSPAEAGLFEFELERRGVATHLHFCERGVEGDRQAVQVRASDLKAALALRREILPERAAPGAPSHTPRRRGRIRNAVIAGALGLVGSMRVARIFPLPKGPATALVVLGAAVALAAAAFGLTRE